MGKLIKLGKDRLSESAVRHRANKHGYRILKRSGKYLLVNERPLVDFHSASREVSEFLKKTPWVVRSAMRRRVRL